MNIFYISQFFLPENIAGAFRAKETTAAWSKRGHQVTVLTGYPNYPDQENCFRAILCPFCQKIRAFLKRGYGYCAANSP